MAYLCREAHERKIRAGLLDITNNGNGCMLVYGEGGVGKSTIVSNIFHDRAFVEDTCGFGVKIWENACSLISSSGQLDKDLLKQKVDDQLQAQRPDWYSLSEDDIVEGMLLVVDDVRDVLLPGGVCEVVLQLEYRWVIIFISRVRHFSIVRWTRYVKHIPPWSKEELAKLFEKQDLETQQKSRLNSLVAICNGLPLVAQILISSLTSLSTDEKLAHIDELVSQGTELVNIRVLENESTISSILQLSLDHIAVPLLNCLYSLLLFEEGEHFGATDLRIIWTVANQIAVADSYITELCDKSLLRPASQSEWECYYTIHAVLRQAVLDHLARSFTAGERYGNTGDVMYLGVCDENFAQDARNYVRNRPTKQARLLFLTKFRRAFCNGRLLIKSGSFDNALIRCVTLERWNLTQHLLSQLSQKSVITLTAPEPKLLKRLFKRVCYDDTPTTCTIFCKICEVIFPEFENNCFEKIADVNAVFGINDETLVMITAESKCRKFLKYLQTCVRTEILVKADSTGNTALHRAVVAGHLSTVGMLLDGQSGTVLSAKNAKGLTALSQGAMMNDVAMVDLLLKHGADANEMLDGEEDLLYFAAGECSAEIVQLLLDNGADFRHTDKAGWAPIHNAACCGRTKNLAVLLNWAKSHDCPQLELKTNSGETPLMVAARYGKVEAVQLLAATHGANLEAADLEGKTALLLASMIEMGHPAARLLIKLGANQNCFRNEAAITEFAKYYHDANDQIQKLLTSIYHPEKILPPRGQVVTVANDDPIWTAVTIGDTEEFVALASTSTIPLLRIRNDQGRSLLHQAAARGFVDIAYCLLEYGADLYAESNSEDFLSKPIHLAALNNRYDVTKLFITKDPDLITARDQNKNCPIHVAAKRGSDSVLALLRKNGADIEAEGELKRTPLMIAASTGQKSIFEMLLWRGADCTKLDFNQSSAIHIAVYFGHLEVVKALLDRRPELLEMLNGFGSTPLFLAASRGRKEIAEFLISKGAKISQGTFFIAVAQHRNDIVQLLLDKNADLIESQNSDGNTALLLAVEHGHSRMVETLLGRGANTSWKNRIGKGAIDLASSPEIKALLLEAGTPSS